MCLHHRSAAAMSLSRTSFSSSKGDSADFETDLTLNDRLKAFKSSQFDPEAYVTSKCQAMSEKEIRHLCAYLLDLKKASAEEMRKSVYANYPAFIRTSKEISDLEGELLSLKNLLSTQTALLHGLAEGIRISSMSTGPEGSKPEDTCVIGNTEQSKIENWLGEFVDTLEVLLAERRVEEALAALVEGETMAEEAKHHKSSLTPTAFLSLHNAITQHRRRLADQLAETASQPSTGGAELRSSVSALKQLGDGHRAHTLLLTCHHQKIQCHVHRLRPSGTAAVGTSYTTSLSQLFFSTIAQAASDSLALFGEDTAYASELVTWAVKQAQDFALLVMRHSLASSSAAGALRAASECVQICLGHCSLLEARGLALSPVLLRFFRPCVDQALSGNLKRIEQSTAALAAVDDWSLSYPSLASRPMSTVSLGNVIASQPRLSSSAHRFHAMVQEMFEEVGPLESLQLSNTALEGLVQVFNTYVDMLINALPGSVETEEGLHATEPKIVSVAQVESQQIALLANASLLADESLPRAAMKITSSSQAGRIDEPPRKASDRQNRPEQRELKKRLQRSVDRLRDSFCRHHALQLIFTEDGDARLSAEMYICLDGHGDDQPEWFPSAVFQEFFAKLTCLASIATDMFVGRERFATILLMRLTETIILWLSNDQNFWEELEAGSRPLGHFGLQQLYLDMEFVILFTSQGRYLSRNIHQVIKNIIARALEAVAATGLDPYSVLPDDEWFAEIAEIAIKTLNGKADFENEERDILSPTASLSAKSMSSVVSHGSN